ncbi:hypothetical protein SAMN05421823_102612 [Catalinimonas alkaloidigena]|uniref:Lipocalin-like domain-containing protein n=1 Tax=Catalinimonas alkaloidigena TaxID=1075417 RepID=A0A1G9BH24_9BACT|nr:hypothetical protein [Catalinimonas alkaloidigena]SDK38737.1 hypothetical protein SAMN05421823_102612 [Catalinimonas alkaloidigena]
MKRSLFLASVIILFAAAQCRQDSTLEATQFYGTWMHSFEEDTDLYKVYRLADYDFPPARGRDGFTIAENGDFVLLEIAPADGLESRQGKWTRDKNTLTATLDETDRTYTIKVVGVDEGVMRIERE